MCCLFGLMDTRNRLTVRQKNRLLLALAIASEARGTDATGIAYNLRGKLLIYKRPWPGRCMRFRVPENVRTVMGHTRMATQGNCRKNYNNHPFPGRAGERPFALAHNGVLYNDGLLRRKLALPETRIETDSYIAVQLIEQKKTLTLDSLQFMAEQVRGSFAFTVLDEAGSLYIVKGDSPFCLYHYPGQGLYLYCSTEEILQTALAAAGLRLERPERIPLRYGDILEIDPAGGLRRGEFQYFGKPYDWQGSIFPPFEETSYLEALRSVAGAFGVFPEEIDQLHRSGFTPEEIEDALYNREL